MHCDVWGSVFPLQQQKMEAKMTEAEAKMKRQRKKMEARLDAKDVKMEQQRKDT